MQFLNFNSAFNHALPVFKEYIVFSLNTLQKKVTCIALFVFGCLSALYDVFYPIYLKWNCQQLKEEDLLNSHEIEEWTKKLATPIPSFSEILNDLVKDDPNYLYCLLLSNSAEFYNYIDIKFKNTSSIEDARIILIGSTHIMLFHDPIMIYIIDYFGKNNDILLLEGSEGKAKKIFKHMDAYGWDNLELFDKGTIFIREFLDLYKSLKLEGFPNSRKLSEQEMNRFLEIKKKHSISTHERNLCLIRSINDFLFRFPDRKIFAFAGKEHFIVEDTVEDAYNILDHLPSEEKYALIMLKNIGPTEDGIEYLESLVAGIEQRNLGSSFEVKT